MSKVSVFQLHPKSSEKELELCINFLRIQFDKKSFKNISVIVRSKKEQDQINQFQSQQNYGSTMNPTFQNDSNQKPQFSIKINETEDQQIIQYGFQEQKNQQNEDNQQGDFNLNKQSQNGEDKKENKIVVIDGGYDVNNDNNKQETQESIKSNEEDNNYQKQQVQEKQEQSDQSQKSTNQIGQNEQQQYQQQQQEEVESQKSDKIENQNNNKNLSLQINELKQNKEKEQTNDQKSNQIEDEQAQSAKTLQSECSTIYNLAIIKYRSKNFQEAYEMLKKSQMSIETNNGTIGLDEQENMQQTILNYQYMGSCLMHLKRIEEALEYLDTALEKIEEMKTKFNIQIEPQQLYFIYNTKGYCYNEKRVYDSMIKYWEKAKQYLLNMEEQEQENQKNLGHLLNNIGMAYFATNNLTKAQESFEESVEIYKEIYGENDISVGNRMNNLAETYRMNKQYNKALVYFQKALTIKKQHFQSENDKSIANTLCNIGMTYQNLKEYNQAIEYFLESVAIFKKIFPVDADRTSDTGIQGNSINFSQTNNLENTQNQYNQSSKHGDSIIANVYNCLGECYKASDNHKLACQYFTDSYNVKKRIYGVYHKKTLHTLMQCAQSLFKSEQYEDSYAMFQELLEGQKRECGIQSIQVGQTLNNLGTVLNSLKRYKEAIVCFTESQQILQASGEVPQASIDKINTYIIKIKQKQQQEEQKQSQIESLLLGSVRKEERKESDSDNNDDD